MSRIIINSHWYIVLTLSFFTLQCRYLKVLTNIPEDCIDVNTKRHERVTKKVSTLLCFHSQIKEAKEESSIKFEVCIHEYNTLYYV